MQTLIVQPTHLPAYLQAADPRGFKERLNTQLGQFGQWLRWKVLILGQDCIGKTSLVRCFQRHENPKAKFSGPPLSTDGINFHAFKITHQNKLLHFDLWDFAGQSVYKTTHQVARC